MIGVREIFTSITERYLEIYLGDNAKYREAGLGTVSFQKESEGLLEVKDVLYVLGLTKNLLSIS